MGLSFRYIYIYLIHTVGLKQKHETELNFQNIGRTEEIKGGESWHTGVGEEVHEKHILRGNVAHGESCILYCWWCRSTPSSIVCWNSLV